MSIAKVLELISEGDSIENALENAVTEAGKSVKKIQNVYLVDVKAVVDDGKITKYRTNVKVTFVVDND